VKPKIMYIEPKGIEEHKDSLPGRIGKVTFSKSGKSIYYKGKTFSRSHEACGNYFDIETGESYWISGCRKKGDDRLFPGIIEIDDDVREEYWTKIRNMPDCKDQSVIRCTGKHGGKQGRRR